MTLRRRTFPEVLENLLTTVTGGVAAESHPFPPPGVNGPPYAHSLQQPPAADVISVYGMRAQESHLFRKGVDYKLLPDQQTLAWEEKAELPDPGTLVHVNYYPASTQRVLSDVQVGSVLRTLTESAALEIARLYAQLQAVYESGFVDTATGKALDNVVSLLGVERVRGGRPAGEVELTRAPNVLGAIAIPAGTRVMTADGEVEYETTAAVTFAPGQTTIRVSARDLEDGNEPLPAGVLTVLPIPIAGVGGVVNPAPTALAAEDETDEQLRARAKSFLHGSERGTLGALRQAIARQQIQADVVEGAKLLTDGTVVGTPGVIDVTPHADPLSPELEQRLFKAIEDTRPAGVLVRLGKPIPPKKVNLELRLTTVSTLMEQDLRAVHKGVRDKVEAYFAKLPAREPGKINQLVAQVMSVEGVEDVRLMRAWTDDETDVVDRDQDELDIGGYPTVLGELQLADPNLPTLLTVTIAHAKDKPPDQPKLEEALAKRVGELNQESAEEGNGGAKVLYDDLSELPGLPDDAEVQFTLTLETGLSRILAKDKDEYQLTPFERLALRPIELATKDGGV
jgi:uncharacterized phage protein gp47/JayE